jgi:hypothetical protein
MGRRHLRPPRHPDVAAARGEGLRRRFGTTRPDLFGRPRSRSSASRATSRPRPWARPASSAGDDEIHLRHRLLRAAEHRRQDMVPRRTACSPPSPTSWTADDLCARRLDLHRRRRGAMAARRAQDHPRGEGDPAPGRCRRPAQDVVLVPAFTGLGAPYWRPDCRGAVYGLTRNSGPGRTRPRRAGKRRLPDPRPAGGDARRLGRSADGGPARRWRHDGLDWTMQFLADILGAPGRPPEGHRNHRPRRGLSGRLQAGICPARTNSQKSWALERRFTPAMDDATRNAKYARWGRAVAATMTV